jgi:2-dehydro-3-deoxygluconokinase
MTTDAPAIACIGECMIEVACLGEGLGGTPALLGFGGDTLNTALYLAREGVNVDYHTALGDDAASAQMLAAWTGEGIGTGTVEIVAGASPGLYLVRTDAHGERSFQFWREHSPARHLCALPGWPARVQRLRGYEWLYFSAITLSILGEQGRGLLFDAIDAARAGGARIAFDSNYRPRHWPDADTARSAVLAALRRCDLALPTFDDERALFGDTDPEQTLQRLRALGVDAIAIKLGALGALLHDVAGTRRMPAPPVTDVIDTTAAGDAFNAGLLAGLIRGEPMDAAAQRGHALAGIVIRHRGAIAPRDATARDPSRSNPAAFSGHAA